MRRAPLPSLALAALAGCAPEDPPVPVAWQGGVGWWPENSRTAIQGALDHGYPALHVQVFLTNDRVPVLNDGPKLDRVRCETVDGEDLAEDVWLLQWDRVDLDAGWRCGGRGDPDHPDAARVADTLMDLDELAAAVADTPERTVFLELAYEPNVSHDPEVFAAEVLERWWAAGADNPLRVVADLPVVVAAVEDRAARRDREVVTLLAWPRIPPRGSQTLSAVAADLGQVTGVADALSAREAAGADGLLLPWRLAERQAVRRMGDAGAEVALAGFPGDRAPDAFARWGATWALVEAPTPRGDR